MGKQARRWSVGPDQCFAVGLSGPWTLPMVAPTVHAVPRKSDWTIGVMVGDVLIERTRPRIGAALESVDALIERAAIECGTEQTFKLVYATDPVA